MMRRMLLACSLALVSVAAGVVAAQAQKTGAVAQTPPMGWNSWDAYGLTITEAQFRANVAVQAKQLLPFGWRYAVIDEGWFLENPEDRPRPETLRYRVDGFGRYVPVPSRFPSASLPSDAKQQSFAALSRDVHAQGLLFGIHIVRGVPRVSVARNLPIEGSEFRTTDAADQNDACPWDPTNWGVRDTPAGQAWYDSLLRQYAGWGVDLLKVDCISDHPYKESEIRMIRKAIERSGRPMVLSLSPGPTAIEHAKEVGELAQMWRISDDIWDVWAEKTGFPQSVHSQFARLSKWQPYAKPGNWPDADMLPLGELRPSPGWGEPRTSRLTAEEQKTMVTLWSMARSPLILGANLTLLDEATLRLLQNRALLAVDQTATASREAAHVGDVIAWTADMPDGSHALAVFNLGDTPAEVSQPLAAYGLDGLWTLRDGWSGQDLGKRADLKRTLALHACMFLTLKR